MKAPPPDVVASAEVMDDFASIAQYATCPLNPDDKRHDRSVLQFPVAFDSPVEFPISALGYSPEVRILEQEDRRLTAAAAATACPVCIRCVCSAAFFSREHASCISIARRRRIHHYHLSARASCCQESDPKQYPLHHPHLHLCPLSPAPSPRIAPPCMCRLCTLRCICLNKSFLLPVCGSRRVSAAYRSHR